MVIKKERKPISSAFQTASEKFESAVAITSARHSLKPEEADLAALTQELREEDEHSSNSSISLLTRYDRDRLHANMEEGKAEFPGEQTLPDIEETPVVAFVYPSVQMNLRKSGNVTRFSLFAKLPLSFQRGFSRFGDNLGSSQNLVSVPKLRTPISPHKLHEMSLKLAKIKQLTLQNPEKSN